MVGTVGRLTTSKLLACVLASGSGCSTLLGIEDPQGEVDEDAAGEMPEDATSKADATAGPRWALRTPARNAYIGSVHIPGSLRPTFEWQPMSVDGSDDVDYRIELSSDALFNSIVLAETTPSTRFRPIDDLEVERVAPVGRRYYWRVRACRPQTDSCSPFTDASWVNVGRNGRDANGDGFADVVVGSSLYGGGTGAAYLFLGSTVGVAETPAAVLTGVDANSAFGYDVGIAGDVDADGYADIIVGAFQAAASGTNRGRVYLYRGGSEPTFDTTPDSVLSGEGTSDFGISVAGVGDLNGDGYSDIAAGAIEGSCGGGAGCVFVFFGSADGVGGGADTILSNDAILFGRSLGASGDVDADGYADLFVGAAGAAFLYRGGPGQRLDTAHDAMLSDGMMPSAFGHIVEGAGDVNGDRFDDLLVASYDGSASSGRVRLFLGGSGAFDTSADGTLAGVAAEDSFGASAAAAGDVNRDGYSDIIVGAQADDTAAQDAGRAYIFFGGAGDTFNVGVDAPVPGNIAGDYFGQAVATAGDVNGDGTDDFIVGLPRSDAGGQEAGRAFVYLGAPVTGIGQVAGRLTGGESGGYFGSSVGP
jgi:hypothetical protein